MNFTISQKILNRRHKGINTFLMPHAASVSPSCLGTMWVVLLTTAVGSLLTSMAECEGSRVDERENFLFCTHDLIQHLQHQCLRPMDFCSPLQVYIHNHRSKYNKLWSFNNLLTPTSPCSAATIASFLSTNLHTFPPWLRLVVTLRTSLPFVLSLKYNLCLCSSHLRGSVTTYEAGTPEIQRSSPGAAS